MYEMIFGTFHDAWIDSVGADTVILGFQFLMFSKSGLWVEDV